MFVQRLSDFQILTDIPTKEASELVWRAFSLFGLSNVVIDAQQRKVTGSTGVSLSSYGKIFAATFEWHPNGLLISLRGDELVSSVINSSRGKKQIAELTNRVLSQLERATQNPNNSSSAVELAKPITPVAPIASPYSAPQSFSVGQSSSGPIYGVAAVPKRGLAVLIYGILGLFLCCHIPAIFALIEGSKALSEYKTQDPGDKTLVYIGMGLGFIGVGLMFFGPMLRSLAK